MRSIARAERPALDLWTPRILGLVLSVLVWLPVLGRGYVLSYDMVFVPHPALNGRTLGLDGGVPRAVPGDFVVALLTRVLPGWVLQESLLVAIVLVAAVGAWRLSSARTLPAAAATAVLYAWNPYMAERLAIGHWSLLVGYAVLPWLLRAALRAGSHGLAPVVVLAGVAAFAAPTAGVLAAGVAVAGLVAARLGTRRRVAGVLLVAVLNLPWLLAGAATSGVLSADRSGATAFAARADTPLGGLASVLTFGGIWNSLVWSPSRASPASALGVLLLVVLAVVGLAARARVARREVVAVAVLGVAGLVLAIATLTSPGRDLLASLVVHLPAAGLLRDAQKWLAWWALAAAYGLGPGLETVASRLRLDGRAWPGVSAAVLAVVTLPGLAWGVGGQLDASTWPAEYDAVARQVDADPQAGSVLVLPFHSFRAWRWNHDRTTLDPWQRLVTRDVVVNDDLELTRGTVPGEDPTAAAVGDLLGSGSLDAASLRAIGIGIVVVDRATVRLPGDALSVAGAQVVHEGRLLQVLDLGGPVAEASRPDRRWLLAVDVVVLLTWLLALAANCRSAGTSLLTLRRRSTQG